MVNKTESGHKEKSGKEGLLCRMPAKSSPLTDRLTKASPSKITTLFGFGTMGGPEPDSFPQSNLSFDCPRQTLGSLPDDALFVGCYLTSHLVATVPCAPASVGTCATGICVTESPGSDLAGDGDWKQSLVSSSECRPDFKATQKLPQLCCFVFVIVTRKQENTKLLLTKIW